MLKTKLGKFTNSYGYTQTYVKLMLESYMTGHSNLFSPIESYDRCDNCDGARCDSCKEAYVLKEYSVPKLTEDGTEYIRVLRSEYFDTDEEKKLALALFDVEDYEAVNG